MKLLVIKDKPSMTQYRVRKLCQLLECEDGGERDVKWLSMFARSKIHAKPVDTGEADYLLQELVAPGERIERHSLVVGASG